MGKASGNKRRGKKAYNYNINRRKQWKKMKRLPKLQCKEIVDAWDDRRGFRTNMKNIGLVSDPNKISQRPNIKEDLKNLLGYKKEEEVSEVLVLPKPVNEDVLKVLESKANKKKKVAAQLPKEVARLVIYMMEKHGEDYKAMAKDRKNYYQLTPNQIKKSVLYFKRSQKQFKSYTDFKASLEDGEVLDMEL